MALDLRAAKKRTYVRLKSTRIGEVYVNDFGERIVVVKWDESLIYRRKLERWTPEVVAQAFYVWGTCLADAEVFETHRVSGNDLLAWLETKDWEDRLSKYDFRDPELIANRLSCIRRHTHARRGAANGILAAQAASARARGGPEPLSLPPTQYEESAIQHSPLSSPLPAFLSQLVEVDLLLEATLAKLDLPSIKLPLWALNDIAGTFKELR